MVIDIILNKVQIIQIVLSYKFYFRIHDTASNRIRDLSEEKCQVIIDTMRLNSLCLESPSPLRREIKQNATQNPSDRITDNTSTLENTTNTRNIKPIH